jgi:hypothetical protein
MIERAQRRLRQARFFYQHLLNARHSTKGDPEAFRFYFSAFIEAARAVTWTIKKEETEKWKAWEPTWRAKRDTEEQKLLDITNEFRTDEVHRGGADLTVEFEEVALDELFDASHSWHPAYYQHMRRQHMRRLPGASPPKAMRPAYYFEDEDGKKDVTEVCRRYLEVLEKVVKDFCANMNLSAGND